jgi:hypothetical protein
MRGSLAGAYWLEHMAGSIPAQTFVGFEVAPKEKSWLRQNRVRPRILRPIRN